jgi:uncharacterized protein
MALWDKITTRGNVEDRRSYAPVGGLSLGALLLIIAINYFLGGDLSTILQDVNTYSNNSGQVQSTQQTADDPYADFASAVVGSSDDIWTQKFIELGVEYQKPRLVLFRNATDSGCGFADSRVGPHYCPVDNTIYLDETFLDMLIQRLGADGGDVAHGYVIAHEVGHHVQNLLGKMDEMNETSSEDRQQFAIDLELQADCYAGIWAKPLSEGVFEPGEIKEAMDAAQAVGDDRVQKTTQGHVRPENWTHGSSEERLKWFTTGFESGSVQECNTFEN